MNSLDFIHYKCILNPKGAYDTAISCILDKSLTSLERTHKERLSASTDYVCNFKVAEPIINQNLSKC